MDCGKHMNLNTLRVALWLRHRDGRGSSSAATRKARRGRRAFRPGETSPSIFRIACGKEAMQEESEGETVRRSWGAGRKKLEAGSTVGRRGRGREGEELLGYNQTSRGVAQSGSASALGAEGRGFESLRPDHSKSLAIRDLQASLAAPLLFPATAGVVDFVAVGASGYSLWSAGPRSFKLCGQEAQQSLPLAHIPLFSLFIPCHNYRRLPVGTFACVQLGLKLL